MINIWWGLLPFVTLFVALLVFKRSLLFSGCIFLLTAATLGLLVWLVFPAVMAGAILKGLLVSFDIILIITGSLLFLDVLKKLRILSSLEHYLHKLTPDSRVQAVLFAWFFSALIEGAAGFGAPAAIIAPLLVHLGFPVITAAALSLLGNTVPVSFGAVGTPIRVGFNGIMADNIIGVIAVFGLILSFIVPYLQSKLISQDISVRKGIIGLHGFNHKVGDGFGKPSSILPFVIWSGLAFGLPYFVACHINPETPALFGGLFGLGLTLLCSKSALWRQIFLPKVTQRLDSYDPNEIPLTFIHTIMPYVLMVVLLIISRQIFPSFKIELMGDISHTVNLYNPGLILIGLAIVYAVTGNYTWPEFKNTSKSILRRILRTAATVSVLVAGVQLMLHSASNYYQIPGMLSGFTKMMHPENIGIFSPLIGGIGAFVAGSTTVSNLMFGQLQLETANLLGTNAALILTLQLFGATAGNAMALTNISAVEGVLSLKHQSRAILKKLAVPVGLYLLAIILIGALVPIFI